MKPFGSIGVGSTLMEINWMSAARCVSPADPAKRSRQRRADRRACSEDKVDGNGLAFHKVAVESERFAVFIVDPDIRDP
jgi:hypothetical protein